MLEQKDYLINKINKLNEKFEEEQRDNTKTFTEITNTLRNHNSKFIEFTRDQSQMGNRLERLKESQLIFDKELKNLGIGKLDLSSYRLNQDKFEKDMASFAEQLDSCRVQCTTLDRFVDRYLPVRTQTLICDTLHEVLGQSSRHRLQIYEIEAFKRLNNAVLNDKQEFDGKDYKTVPIDLKNSIQEVLERLIKTMKETQAREEARKLMQDQNNRIKALKRSFTKDSGDELDNL